MRLFLTMLILLVVPTLASQQAPQQVPARQLEVKIGWGLELKPPIAGGTIVFMDEHSVVLGIQTSNADGVTYWPHPGDKKFQVAVLVVGSQAKTFNEEMMGRYTALNLVMYR